jgi:hypothetical protein
MVAPDEEIPPELPLFPTFVVDFPTQIIANQPADAVSAPTNHHHPSMKRQLFAAIFAAALCLPVSARTWTSKDGTKTFQGELRSYDKESGKVTVILRNGRKTTFDKSKLSKDDVSWLEENAGTASATGGNTVGDMLAETKLYRLAGKKLQETTLDKTPDYYLLYFTATW